MASIENKSRFVVTVKNCEHLTKTFACNREAQLKEYLAELKSSGYKPKLARTNDAYVVRIRNAGHKTQTLSASTEQEALDIKQRIELERRKGLFVDYAKGRSVTFADLLTRYLREISPRHKGFEIEGYIVNALLADAGLPRVDIAQAYADHKLPHPSLATKTFRKPSGKRNRMPCPSSCFIRKPFADLEPEDFNDYILDRCQTVEGATVDREIDLFSATCRVAIDTWRIPVAKSPIDVRSFNQGDVLHDVLRKTIGKALHIIGDSNKWNIRFVDIKTEDEFIEALENFDGAVMVFDGHGTYDSSNGAGKLVIGDQRVDIWELKGRIKFPPVVILSACDTQPLEAGHGSAATAAFTFGALAVLGTTLPILGENAGLFIARLLLQIHFTFADHIRKGGHVTWCEVVAGMTRMAYVTEVMQLLHKNMSHIYTSQNYLDVQAAANTAILQRQANWHVLFIEKLASRVGHGIEMVAQNVAEWGGMTEVLKYTHLGRPENIIITPDDINE
nr:hypothetical protein [uncultured Duganella sp.]